MHPKPLDPFLNAWLRRTRKQLLVSGRLSEVALILSRSDGGDPVDWSRQLHSMLDGDLSPSLDLVTAIDSILARPGKQDLSTPGPVLF